MGTSYWDYIRVEDLLRLQGGLDDNEADLTNHEVTFITVHQVFELWFRLVIRELEGLRAILAQPVVPEQEMAAAARGLDRVKRIFVVANDHWQVMESLNTRDYLDFRDKLFPASGFQSAQMREIEILLGLDDDDRVGLGGKGGWIEALKSDDGTPSPAHERVQRRLADDAPSLREAVDAWLHRTPIRGSQPFDAGDDAVVDGFICDYLDRMREVVQGTLEERLDVRLGEEAKAGVRARYAQEIADAEAWLNPDDARRRRIRAAILFIESYRALPMLSGPRDVLDRLVETEQAILIFRQRHARMVERIIGRRVGTGGSSGVDYLDATAVAYRVFKDLWSARTYLLRRDALPPLPDPSFYEFPDR